MSDVPKNCRGGGDTSGLRLAFDGAQPLRDALRAVRVSHGVCSAAEHRISGAPGA